MTEAQRKAVLTRTIQVRVSPKQYEQFEKAAARDERSLSNWARERLIAAARTELAPKAARGSTGTVAR